MVKFRDRWIMSAGWRIEMRTEVLGGSDSVLSMPQVSMFRSASFTVVLRPHICYRLIIVVYTSRTIIPRASIWSRRSISVCAHSFITLWEQVGPMPGGIIYPYSYASSILPQTSSGQHSGALLKKTFVWVLILPTCNEVTVCF